VILVVPVPTLVTRPAVLPIVATPGVLLVQVPVKGILLSNVFAPMQMLVVPVIALGDGFTVTAVVLRHPVGRVYEIIAVPMLIPVTIPAGVPVTAVASELLHEPPDGLLVRLMLAPVHTAPGPVIGAGSGLTVTIVER
jgi:hypothetical protein